MHGLTDRGSRGAPVLPLLCVSSGDCVRVLWDLIIGGLCFHVLSCKLELRGSVPIAY